MSDVVERADGLEHVLTRAKEASFADVDDAVDALGRDRLVEAVLRNRARRRPVVWRTFAVAALALSALLSAVAVVVLRERPLDYEVRGATVAATYLSVPEEAPAEVTFSDGSAVEAEPGARLRIAETTSTGARVLVERGAATARVRHRARSGWVFVAGPFEVHVTGTRFTVAWDPSKEEIDLVLHEGSVEVESPAGPSRFAVRAGQRFRASLRGGTMAIESFPGVNSAPKATEPAEATKAPRARARTDATFQEGRGGAPGEDWPELVGRGDFDGVVRSARARGIDSCLASCGATELRALADAARYTGAGDIAERSLLSLRQRFPGSPKSASAAFLIGRTSESGGRLGAADQWYRTYLSESPNGEFAAEALAGRMRVAAAQGGPALARPLALDYLRRHPKGVHADAARAIAGR